MSGDGGSPDRPVTGDPPAPVAEPEATVARRQRRGPRKSRAQTAGWLARRFASSTRRFVGVLVALILMTTLFAVTQDRFLSATNFDNILRTQAVLFMVSVGNTFVLLTAGFDLSVGSMLTLAGVALAFMIGDGWNDWLAIVATLGLTTMLGGLVNGVLIGKAKLSFFVVTLATLSLFRGITDVWTQGFTKSVPSEVVADFGDGKIGGLSVPVLLMAGVLVASLFVLHYTRFGRAVYAVGGNREAARLSGINVARVIIAVYAISGLLAGLAGIIQVGRLGAASPTIARSGIELSAAAAVLLGGTSFSGGSGGVGGTLIGVLFIGILRNGLGLAGVSAFWQDIVTGAILITAIAFDRISQARSG
jgi:ribose transport system permease protein